MRRALAVKDVTLDVRKGEAYGIIGPNGAGKTTTIKMITGLVWPDSGEITIAGLSPQDREARRTLGYLPENPYFYEHLKVGELLNFYGKMFGIGKRELDKRIPELVHLVGLDEATTKPLKKFSKGMRQRAGLAQALINDPEILILDEPQSGLDPVGRKEVRDLLLRLKSEGKTIVFSSHILHDIEDICDRVAVFSKGSVIGVNSLVDSLTPQGYEVMYLASDALEGLESEMKGPNLYSTQLSSDSALESLISRLGKSNGRIYQVTPMRPDLESIVMNTLKDEKGK